MNKRSAKTMGVAMAFAIMGSLVTGSGAITGYQNPQAVKDFESVCFADSSGTPVRVNEKILSCMFLPGAALGNGISKLSL